MRSPARGNAIGAVGGAPGHAVLRAVQRPGVPCGRRARAARPSASRAARRSVALLLLLPPLLALLAGCGGSLSAQHERPASTADPVTVHRSRPTTPAHGQSVAARVDVASDAVLAEGKIHIAEGAPSDAQIRSEVKALRRAGIVLPSGDSAESFERGSTYTGAAALQIETPETAWTPRLKPIADWIIPVLTWAAAHGWSGTVTSGIRTHYEQAQLNAAGAFSAPAGRATTKPPSIRAERDHPAAGAPAPRRGPSRAARLSV